MARYNIYDLLIDPISGMKLFPDGNTLKSRGNDTTYPIIDGVPYILPEEAKENEYGMDYRQHYETDSHASDYFAPEPCGATADDFRRLRQAIAGLVPKSTGLILDAGSGGAWAAKSLCSEDRSVCSFDISLRNTTRALKLFPHENHSAVAGDALRPPFREGAFDCVISSEVIEHVVDPSLFVASLFNLVKPGGRLIISTPYKEKLQYDICIHCNKPTPRNAHLHSFDEARLREAANLHEAARRRMMKLGNKALIFSRSYVITRALPFRLWRLIDFAAGIVINRPAHIILAVDKK